MHNTQDNAPFFPRKPLLFRKESKSLNLLLAFLIVAKTLPTALPINYKPYFYLGLLSEVLTVTNVPNAPAGFDPGQNQNTSYDE